MRNGLVKGNKAENNRSDKNNPWYKGDASAGGFYVDGGKDIIFEQNISTGNNLGFEFASEHENKATENITLRNNLVYLNTEAGVGLGGSESDLGSAEFIRVVNNTFYKNRGWGSEIVFQHKVKIARSRIISSSQMMVRSLMKTKADSIPVIAGVTILL